MCGLVLPKPEACRGCPADGDGRGYVPDRIVPNAEVVVYGQGPGDDEEAGQRYLGQGAYEPCTPQPFIGKTGFMLDKFLQIAGLDREQVSLANTFRCRFKHSNFLPPLEKAETRTALKHCTQVHWRPPEGVKLYVAMGEYACAALTATQTDFSGWRGYLQPYRAEYWSTGALWPVQRVWHPGPGEPPPVLTTFHLAYLFREPEAELPTKRDWAKVRLILDGKWPVPMSEIIREPPDLWPSVSAFDSEYQPEHPDRLVRWSMATPDRWVYVVEAADTRSRITIPPGSQIVLHNAPVDIPHLDKFVDLDGVRLDDSMYASAVLWTGKVATDDEKGKAGGAMSHKLNFLGSLHARINRWKHLVHANPVVYAGGDAMGTMDVWSTGLNGGLWGQLERDPQSFWVYEHLMRPLLPLIMKHRKWGIRTNPAAAKKAIADITRLQDQEVMRARAYTGWWGFKLTSPKQVGHWLYAAEKLKVRRIR